MEILLIDGLPWIVCGGLFLAVMITLLFRMGEWRNWPFSREMKAIMLGLHIGSLALVATVSFLYLDDYREVKDGIGKRAWEEDQLRQWERHVVSCDGVAETYLATMDGLNGNGKILLSRQFKAIHPECDGRMKYIMEERVKGVLKK